LIGIWYEDADETLRQQGLPPNRMEGETGFLTWETSGRKGVGDTASGSHPMAYCQAIPD
jgi:hypothetical protein